MLHAQGGGARLTVLQLCHHGELAKAHELPLNGRASMQLQCCEECGRHPRLLLQMPCLGASLIRLLGLHATDHLTQLLADHLQRLDHRCAARRLALGKVTSLHVALEHLDEEALDRLVVEVVLGTNAYPQVVGPPC